MTFQNNNLQSPSGGGGGFIKFTAGSVLTPSGGVIVPTTTCHHVAAGTISTISTTNLDTNQQQFLMLIADGAITITNGATIQCKTTTLNINDVILLFLDGGSLWREVSDYPSIFAIGSNTTANQTIISQASGTPIWSTATYPATTTINQLLFSSAANTIAGLATANSGLLVTNASGVPSISATLPGLITTATAGIAFAGSTSGTATLVAPATATGTITLPNASSTLPIFSQQITFAGPTAARTVTFPDASFTAARTDAAQTFTGTQTFTNIVASSIGTAGATAFQFLTNNTVQVTIDSSGNFGIGGAPSGTYKLELRGIAGATFQALGVIGSTTGAGLINVTNTGGSSVFTTESSVGGSIIAGTSSYATVVGSYSATPLQLVTNNTVRHTIDSSGNQTIVGSGGASRNLNFTGTGTGSQYISFSNSGAVSLLGIENNLGNTLFATGSTAYATVLGSQNGSPLLFATNNAVRTTIDANANLIHGTGALGTTATNGFLYIPTCAGAPTGVPTAYTGRSPIIFDSTNNKIWVYINAAWKGVVIA